jgi:hypothetical protein
VNPLHLAPLLVPLSLLAAPAPVARDLGIPVKSVSWVRLHPGRGPDGGPSLLASMGQNNGGLFVLDIDLATGHCRQFNAPDKAQQAPTASFRSPHTGALYVGSASDGHLLRFDPARRGRGLEDLGPIYAGHATFPTGFDEAGDGALWIGAYPECTLTRFDPATGHFTQFGSMDATDHYVSVLCGVDGTISALAINVHPHLVALDPGSGEHRAVGPLVNNEDRSQYLQFFKGVDGLLYLDTHAGKFRVHGLALEPVSYLPLQMPGVDATYRHAYQEMPTLPGGLFPSWVDGDEGGGTYRKLLIESNRSAPPPRPLTLDWQGAGSNIFMLHLGPDGLIYGSTIGPEHLFRCSPDGGGMIDLGRCSASLGEAYTMGNFSDGTMAIASYIDSRISLFDPRRPCHYGATAGDNPRDVGSLDRTGLRPVAMAIVPALTAGGGRTVPERMWIGSLPYYGTWGGTLAWLEPRTLASASHRALVPDCSPFSLLWMPGLQRLLVGMSVQAGTGAAPKARRGAFVLWDPVEDRPTYTGDFGIRDLPDVLALTPAGDGRVYALLGHTSDTARSLGGRADQAPRLALLDPAVRRVLADSPLPASLGALPEHDCCACLFRGPGGTYGMTAHALYRVKPGTCEAEAVWRAPAGDGMDKPGPWVGRTFYFSTQWRLRALTLP